LIHNDEAADLDTVLRGAGVTLENPQKSSAGFPTTCWGGGGGGFLWDSPAKVNQKRWEQIRATGLRDVVTGCPGCHRMLGVMKDEESRISDVSTVLAERLPVS
jgi:Fe-S oxidoreductase